MNVPAPRSGATWITEDEYDYYSPHGTIFEALAQKMKLATKATKVDVDARAPLPETPTSSLDEHVTYLDLQQKKTAAMKRGFPDLLALSSDEHDVFNRIHQTVKTEQRNFHKSFDTLAKADLFVLTALPEGVETAVDAFLRKRCADAAAMYPAAYSRVSIISFPSMPPTHSPPKHIARVARATAKPALKRPLPSPLTTLDAPIAWTTGCVLSKDTKADELIAQEDCDVAMATSTLTMLFDMTPDRFRQEWIIPVVVRAGPKKKHVVFDKPLVNAVWSGRKKLTLFARKRLKAAMTETSSSRVYSYHTWSVGSKKMLLRTQTHGFDPEKNVDVAIQAKVDYEWCSTPERITESERARWWLQSWIRGNAGIVVGRMHANGAKVLDVSDKTITSVASSVENPLAKFVMVQEVIAHMGELPPGEYLLSYDPSYNGIHVYNATTDDDDKSDEATLRLPDLMEKAGRWDRTLLDSVLPEWREPGQIQYTFALPTYCKSYFETNGTCARLAKGYRCAFVHLRRDPQRPQLYMIQPVIQTQFKRELPARKIRFPYCPKALANKCTVKGCSDPHLSQHDVLKRLAREYVEMGMARHRDPKKRKKLDETQDV
ncbi:hypothetical protein SPRG_06012 [Saprolegnia parasitica CBS 223.65]|uniref:Little elongation complex subunit 2 C-terminal domain-containing protein n=1 Tax=Saprolegnia parasitica (strain CBS 223.65) TaxID=695850 RepID=A0A067CG31_SAPPC|nr:hypothetical protein SPRG_06012 [Saprolegnia parasitica CBS 223.65]KDO29473.1 hypothetical protein SPRG_06012 [Saprolegnia parasitica CBS 223.65]|eukprot:XP_012199970.1 hypothetical protein SPRG_06012 [Saprolegnia parasitica CBS 223.65]